MSDEERRILIQTAREAIESRLLGRSPRYPTPTDTLRKRCGAFVTLHSRGKLRGCIGFVVARAPLIDTVKETAQSAAFQDPRFPPLARKEWEEVSLEISVLSPLQEIKSLEEIQVGTHGVMMRRGFQSGLLLPQVATEYGWDRETFLTHTCYKAGLPGDCWRSPETRIEIFSALVFGEEDG
ncbi:MAG: AmmeMemoRadiSam system protein A [Spirochaetales bacterium]|nr:AmmeMemoRadiSam system protein A [Spirochaetales bacterium]